MSTKKTYEEKLKAAQLAVAALDKQFGEGTVMSGTSDAKETEVISTGNLGLDLALGVGGVPKGRITEIYGPEGAGKSLLASTTAGECQKVDGLVAYVDAEHALDPPWMKRQGVDWDRLQVSQPQSGEEALIVVEKLASTGAYDLIIVDSVAALTPLAEINGEIGDAHVGLQARLMGQALRKLNPIISDTDTALIFINQLRDKIGPMAMGGSTTPGGRALKFYASIRIDLKMIKTLRNNTTGEQTGQRIKAHIVKNKVAPPFKYVEYDVLAGQGFNNYKMTLDFATKFGLVIKRGAFYYQIDSNGEIAEKNFGQGEERAAQYLEEDPSFFGELTEKVKKEYRTRSGYFVDELEDEDDSE